MKIKHKIIVSLTAFLLVLGIPAVAADSLFSVVATDTIAGYSAALRSSVGQPYETVIFRVEKPDGGIIEIQEKADETGIAETSFMGFHTKRTGEYKVRAFPVGGDERRAPETIFEVFPDNTSPTRSQIVATVDTAPADQVEPVKVLVKLRDKNENPIPRHYVDLVSSRSEDDIEPIGNGTTNQFGEIIFHIRSHSPGVSYYSAIDRNSGITLDSRAKAVFFESDWNKYKGGLYQANIFTPENIFDPGDDDKKPEGTFGTIDHFGIDFPAKVELNKAQTLKITALDDHDKIISGYTGSIVIQTSDDNAKLPNDGNVISFMPTNQGVRQFDLAVSFSSTGKHNLTVIEYDPETGAFDPNIKGEVTVEVVNECVGKDCEDDKKPGTGNPETRKNLEIKRPKDGDIYPNSQTTVVGSGESNATVKIFLDDLETKEVTTDEDGLFTAELNIPSDGEHILHIEYAEEPLQSTDPVTFTVDTTPPVMENIFMEPEGGVEPGTSIRVVINSEPGLPSVLLKLEGAGAPINSSFQESSELPGEYETNIIAPEQVGEYPLTVTLKDNLDKETVANNIRNVVVKQKQVEIPAPGEVTATPGDTTVTLAWNPPALEGMEGNIAKYQIYSGTNPSLLNPTYQVPGIQHEHVIEQLTNGVEMFFTVSAISPDGLEGKRSETVSATPKAEEKKPVDVTIPGDDDDDDDDDDEEEPIVITPTPGLSITTDPGNGSVRLEWEKPQESVAFYDIRFGVSSEAYAERYSVPGSMNQSLVPDLINGTTYYFTVVPLNSSGVPLADVEYEEVRAMPMFTGVHPVASAPENPIRKNQPKNTTDDVIIPGDTGPESFFLFFLSLSFAAAMFFFHRSIRFLSA